MSDAVKRVNPRFFVRDGKAKLAYGFEEFVVVSTVLWSDIAAAKVGGESLRVLAYLMTVCKHSNRFTETQAVIGERLGLKQQNVSRSFRELREAGYIIRVSDPDGHRYWYLDARRAFRGSPERHAKEMDRQAKQRSKDRVQNVVALRAEGVPA